MDYIKIKDIKEKLLYKYVNTKYITNGSVFKISDKTIKNYKSKNWISIGILEPVSSGLKIFKPLWDVYAPNNLSKKIIENRLKYACMKLGIKSESKNNDDPTDNYIKT